MGICNRKNNQFKYFPFNKSQYFLSNCKMWECIGAHWRSSFHILFRWCLSHCEAHQQWQLLRIAMQLNSFSFMSRLRPIRKRIQKNMPSLIVAPPQRRRVFFIWVSECGRTDMRRRIVRKNKFSLKFSLCSDWRSVRKLLQLRVHFMQRMELRQSACGQHWNALA